VVNEVALNEIMPKGFMATHTGKEIWIGEMTRQLHCTMLKLLMPEIQKIKSILETKYGNGSAFRPKCFASAKTKQRFSGLFGKCNYQLLLMNGTILEIQNLSIQSVRCRSKSQND
jgi:hypothetical protein